MPDHTIDAQVRLRRRYNARKARRSMVSLLGTPQGVQLALINPTSNYSVAQLTHAGVRELISGLVDITMRHRAEADMTQIVRDYHEGESDGV